MKRCILYARVSGDDRDTGGRNLASQLDMCREYAEKRGWTIVAELAEDDRGASGAALDLPQLNAALDIARAGGADVLVTRELDRLARGLAKQLIVEEELRRAGVTIEYVLGEYPDTPEGGLMKNVRAVVAEYERLKINERMTRGRRNKVRDGSVMTHGPAPYGYRRADAGGHSTLEIDEGEAAVVHLIFEWYTSGVSIYGILRRLDKMGVATAADSSRHSRVQKKRPHGTWAKSSVHSILRNETYAGTWRYGKRGTQGRNADDHLIGVEVPAIVSREVWEATQTRRATNRQTAKRNTKYEYLLQRRVWCGRCGQKMTPHAYTSNNRLYLYYRCAVRAAPQNYIGVACDQKHFRSPDVDRTVWEWLRQILADPASLEEGLRQYQAELVDATTSERGRLAVIDGLLADNRTRLDRLLDLYIGGEFTRDQLSDRRLRLEATISGLAEERARVAAEIERGALSDEQITDILGFAAEAAMGLEEADADFEVRRELVEAMDVRVTLDWEESGPVAHASCVLGVTPLSIEYSSTNTTGHNGGTVITARLEMRWG